MTRDGLDQRKVAEELAIDKELYRSHQDCRTLVFFVYDPGHRLTNPTALEADLTDLTSPIPTLLIVAPWSDAARRHVQPTERSRVHDPAVAAGSADPGHTDPPSRTRAGHGEAASLFVASSCEHCRATSRS